MKKTERLHRAPEILDKPFDRGAKKGDSERAAAIKAYKQGGNARKNFEFVRYKHDSVNKALRELFGRKCAYCESFYIATQPMDVEHYRPKGRVHDEPSHPGYYWLAADWDNLLPSCIDCNRRRTQTDARTKVTDPLGKQDRFPIAGVRISEPDGDLSVEEPLLLDPTVDDPDDYFTYEGPYILPSHASGKMRERAQTSIDTYGLNRSGLVELRMEVERKVFYRIDLIANLTAVLDSEELSEPTQWALEDLIHMLVEALHEMMEPDQPYSHFATHLIGSYAPA